MNTSVILGISLAIAAGGWCGGARLFLPATKRLLQKNRLLRKRSGVISVLAILLAFAANLYCARSFLILGPVSIYLIVTLAGTMLSGPVFIFLGHACFLFAAQHLPNSESTEPPESEGDISSEK